MSKIFTKKGSLTYVFLIAVILMVFTTPMTFADTTSSEIQYLSGTDKDHTVDWDFYLNSGRNSGAWTKIKVPGCIETQGFGSYAYKSQYSNTGTAIYKYNFNVPSTWSGKKINIVFEGAGKDITVLVNGISAGATHQGSYYRFKYDISTLLYYSAQNTLEVDAAPNSSNSSVNSAEDGDFWSFWGIMRPVYLEARPAQCIDRVAINAKADGNFSIDTYLLGINGANTITAQIKKLDGTLVGNAFSTTIVAGDTKKTISTTISSPLLWNAENPNLYQVEVSLKNGATEIHKITEKFGFRTVEVRANDGLYINGVKIKGIRGFDRHCFWPTTGKTLSPAVDLLDMGLFKEINANAVRSSHYPPDVNWLDLCDQQGLYVLDELCGWQSAYDNTVAPKLVKEVVTRDVNHPSVIFWDNGNEGGWNTTVDSSYATYDPQNRAVLHPWETFSNINTNHYPAYSTDTTSTSLYMPTEFDHGVGDGGNGGSLNDYWKTYMLRPGSIGGFLWSFVDGGVLRTDLSPQILDCGPAAGRTDNDGVVGPYREKEGSFNTIKEIWSPIYIEMDNYKTLSPSFNGNITINNRYDFTNSNQCTFSWNLVNFKTVVSGLAGYDVMNSGTPSSPNIAAHSSGTLSLGLPSDWANYDGLFLTATDKNGKEIYTWTWSIKKANDYKNNTVSTSGTTAANGSSDASYITVSANGTVVKFSKTTGKIASVTNNGSSVSFTDGTLTALDSSAAQKATSTFVSISGYQSGNDYCVDVTYDTNGSLKYFKWRMYPSGWLQLEYKYNLVAGDYKLYGITFQYPESKINGMRYLGKGPYRVWKNRMKGTTFNVLNKGYNTTERGLQTISNINGYLQPIEFRGYYSNLFWADIDTTEGLIKVVSGNDDTFLQMCPKPSNIYLESSLTDPGFANGTFSFLDAIPPIGDKFKAPPSLGPEAAWNHPSGDYIKTLYFKFGSSGPTPTPGPTATPAPTSTPGPTATPTPTPDPTKVLLSQGQPATASTVQAGNEISYANDGNSSTRWCAADATYPQWWRVDLGGSKNLSKVDIAWNYGATRSYKYKIEVSADDSVYTTVVDKTGNTTNGDTSDSFTAAGRYVRITVTGSSAGWASFYECKVYGSTGSTPTPTPTPTTGPTATPASITDKCTGGTISVSNTSSPAGEDMTKAFDDSSSTKWLIGNTTGWIQYDFAGTTAWAINQYTITSGNDVPARDPKNWTLQGSNDGTNWTTVDTQSNQTFANRLQMNTYSFTNTTAYQIYRLNITANNGDTLLQIAEIEMFAGTN
jgi:hypothetical protein